MVTYSFVIKVLNEQEVPKEFEVLAFLAQSPRKIEPDPNQPRWVKTVSRAGYRFEP
jgi:hypothetical protein